MKAIGYIRVSTEEQAEHGVSLDAQRAKIHAYCTLNDIELVSIFEDAGISGKRSDNRPALQSALNTLRTGGASALIVCKLDRLARNTIDALTIADTLDKKGLALHSIAEKLDTQSAIGRFFFTLTASLAEMERRQIGERTRAAMNHKRSKREFCGGDVPFGFKLENGRVIEDAQEQEIISLIDSLKLDGFSWSAIARELNARGVTTKRGSSWQAVQVQRTIHNTTAWRAVA